MEISSQIIILIIGFVIGSGVVGIFYYFNNSKKKHPLLDKIKDKFDGDTIR